jgi:hypothetical protein
MKASLHAVHPFAPRSFSDFVAFAAASFDFVIGVATTIDGNCMSHCSVFIVNVTVTVFCPVLPPLSVTRQRHVDV